MADENQLKQAQATFETLCAVLDKYEWKYKKDSEKLSIECGAQGEDLPMSIDIIVDAEMTIVILLSHLPFIIPEDKRLEFAVAVSIINNKLVDGSFDYDVNSGHVIFRMTSSFLESVMGSEALAYMLFYSCQIIDEFNDKFLMLSKGMTTLEQFIELSAN